MNVEDIASKISVIFGIQHDWKDQISGFMFLLVVQRHSKGRWDNKSPFNSVLTQQHLRKKLPKSVNVRWSYSVLHHCHFLRHGVLSLYGIIYVTWYTSPLPVPTGVWPWRIPVTWLYHIHIPNTYQLRSVRCSKTLLISSHFAFAANGFTNF